ncbi:MAG: DNA alkylation response protein, partial [Acidobacteriota bacterium]
MSTHEVINQPPPLEGYNLFLADAVLGEAVRREGAEWALASLSAFGELAGRPEVIELGHLAN